MSLISVTLMPPTPADARRLAIGARTLGRRDPTLSVAIDEDTGAAKVAAVGERQLEIVIDRLRQEFDVEASVSVPKVVFREAFTQPSTGVAKYSRRIGDGHEYGHVRLRLYPGAPGSGYVCESEIVGGAIPDQFIAAIGDGIRNALPFGIIAGHAIRDVRVVLDDGSYHDIYSSERAFRIAGLLAFRDAARQAKPVVLEPIMRMSIDVPEECAQDIAANLVARRGHILSIQDCDGTLALVARVPLAELFGYDSHLRDRTKGRGAFRTSLDAYEPCPHVENGGDDRDSFVGAPLKPRPAPRASGIALPEPDPEPRSDERPGSGLSLL